MEGSFVWVNGEVSAFTNWRPGEPNDGNGGEDYAYILAQGLVAEGGAWNDFSNDASVGGQYALYGVVEVVPEPSAGLLLAGGMLTAFGAKRMRSRK